MNTFLYGLAQGIGVVVGLILGISVWDLILGEASKWKRK